MSVLIWLFCDGMTITDSCCLARWQVRVDDVLVRLAPSSLELDRLSGCAGWVGASELQHAVAECRVERLAQLQSLLGICKKLDAPSLLDAALVSLESLAVKTVSYTPSIAAQHVAPADR